MNMENKTTIKLELYIINLQGLKYKTRLEKLLFSQPHIGWVKRNLKQKHNSIQSGKINNRHKLFILMFDLNIGGT
jgi:hypothetical protein